MLLVCHGNVIRYLAGRAIGLDPMKWLNMSIPHASLTTVRVRDDGRMQLLALGDSGFLPAALVTFTNPPRDTTSGKAAAPR